MNSGNNNNKFSCFGNDSLKSATMNLYSYELGYVKPLALKSRLQKNRRGIIVEIKTSNKTTSFGEISPLPFFSKESYEDALAQAKNLRDKINMGGGTLIETLQEIVSGNSMLLPSVQAGVEMALLNYCFYREDGVKGQLDDFVLLNGLISLEAGASDEKIRAEAERIMERGYKTVKIKVGRQSPDKDISMIKKIISITDGSLKLRFDANCSWNLDEAMDFVKKLESGKIAQMTDYIEEPLKNTADLEFLYRQTKIGIALDENQFLPSESTPFLKAVIIKPTIAGGFSVASRKIAYCKGSNIVPVLSSSFETGLGIASIALFAGMEKLSAVAAGLDTLEWFSSDILNRKLPVIDGKLFTANTSAAISDINFNKLKPLN